jgi:hypothetical protein
LTRFDTPEKDVYPGWCREMANSAGMGNRPMAQRLTIRDAGKRLSALVAMPKAHRRACARELLAGLGEGAVQLDSA